jgi:hypothetical protein
MIYTWNRVKIVGSEYGVEVKEQTDDGEDIAKRYGTIKERRLQLKLHARFKILTHFTKTTCTSIFIKHEPAHAPKC